MASTAPFGPLPSSAQLEWSDMEFYLFVHFGPNTFTGREWGKGTEKEGLFNPDSLDCRQWARIAKASGAKGIILTAKHHDGFCLWPSAYSLHTVRESGWMSGRGDVLRQLSDACKAYGLKLGIYLSPWDRNHPSYSRPEYNQVYMNMMREVVRAYGPLFEYWWDGANGEGPNGKKQVYDFHAFEQTMRQIAPNTVVFSDIGPDIRWVGNESGIAGKTNWNLLDTAGFSRGAGAPPADSLMQGNEYGKNWIPAECDVSIRHGWFYHPEEDSTVKSPEKLFHLYLCSVGRGANLLLNVPADVRGKFTDADSAALMGFKKLRDQSFDRRLDGNVFANRSNCSDLVQDGQRTTYVSLGEAFRDNPLTLRFAKPANVDCIILQEPTQLGQRIRSFEVKVVCPDRPAFIWKGTTVGHKRIISFPALKATEIQVRVLDAKAIPLISEFSAYYIPEQLVEQDTGKGSH